MCYQFFDSFSTDMMLKFLDKKKNIVLQTLPNNCVKYIIFFLASIFYCQY